MDKVYKVLCYEKWTSKSPDANEISLELDWKIEILEGHKERVLPEYVKIV